MGPRTGIDGWPNRASGVGAQYREHHQQCTHRHRPTGDSIGAGPQALHRPARGPAPRPSRGRLHSGEPAALDALAHTHFLNFIPPRVSLSSQRHPAMLKAPAAAKSLLSRCLRGTDVAGVAQCPATAATKSATASASWPWKSSAGICPRPRARPSAIALSTSALRPATVGIDSPKRLSRFGPI